MSSIGLLFVGAVLLINGVMLLGGVDTKTAGVFNLFVGGLQTLIPTYLVVTADSADAVLGASGIFLFGFTYLYVGITNLAGYEGTGLGWYSAWVSVLAVGFGVVNWVRFDDPATALLWFQWSVLWALFFALIALGRSELTTLTGWFAIIASVTTCTVPGFVGLLGEAVPVGVVAAALIATAAVVAAIGIRTVPAALATHRSAPAPAPVPVGV
ncbi:AmiS/UreI family transporter [Nocardioides sp.]|uniref:AmiS/UreI family transporter n=1 Tax=Nocardioides sp. TaxID=35761 RepID=UPI003514EF40